MIFVTSRPDERKLIILYPGHHSTLFHQLSSSALLTMSQTLRLYPLSNFTFSTKEAQPEEDPSVAARLQRLQNNYEDFGMRRTAEGVLVVHVSSGQELRAGGGAGRERCAAVCFRTRQKFTHLQDSIADITSRCLVGPRSSPHPDAADRKRILQAVSSSCLKNPHSLPI